MNAYVNRDPELVQKLRLLSDGEPPRPHAPRRARQAVILVGLLVCVGISAVVTWRLWPTPPVTDHARPAPTASLSAPVTQAATAGPASTLQAGPADHGRSQGPNHGIVASGHVIALRSAAIAAEETGLVTQVDAEIGKAVHQGDVLVRLDDRAAELDSRAASLRLESARRSLRISQINRDHARIDLDRARALAATQAGTRVALQAAEQTEETQAESEKVARLAVGEAEVAVLQASRTWEKLTIRAPFDSIVAARGIQVGETAIASRDSGSHERPLLSLFDPRSLVLDVDVAETSIAGIRPGQRGQGVLDAYPDAPFQTVVAMVAPTASAERGTVSVRLAIISSPAFILPNMAVRVMFSPNGTSLSGEHP